MIFPVGSAGLLALAHVAPGASAWPMHMHEGFLRLPYREPSDSFGSHASAQLEELVRLARSGDGQAYGNLYALHAPMVHAVLLTRARASDVDDLMQEVFVDAWRALVSLRDAEQFGAWLAAIARRRAGSRRRAWREHEELSAEIPAPAPGDAHAHETAEILAALRSLPEAYRETLAMRLVEGLSGPEIAELTGLTHGSVRVNLHRGMELLRAELARRGIA